MKYFIYIISDGMRGNIYTGLTSDLKARIGEHKKNNIDGYTKNSGIKNLVYYEEYDNIQRAAARERQIKKWHREWKIKLIEKLNPEWKDLYIDLKG